MVLEAVVWLCVYVVAVLVVPLVTAIVVLLPWRGGVLARLPNRHYYGAVVSLVCVEYGLLVAANTLGGRGATHAAATSGAVMLVVAIAAGVASGREGIRRSFPPYAICAMSFMSAYFLLVLLRQPPFLALARFDLLVGGPLGSHVSSAPAVLCVFAIAGIIIGFGKWLARSVRVPTRLP